MALESRRLHFGPTALRHRQSDARGARICVQGERRGKEEEGKLAPMGRFQGDGGNELSFPRRFSSPREAFSLGSRHYARPVQQLALKLLSRGHGAAGVQPPSCPHPVPIPSQLRASGLVAAVPSAPQCRATSQLRNGPWRGLAASPARCHRWDTHQHGAGRVRATFRAIGVSAGRFPRLPVVFPRPRCRELCEPPADGRAPAPCSPASSRASLTSQDEERKSGALGLRKPQLLYAFFFFSFPALEFFPGLKNF